MNRINNKLKRTSDPPSLKLALGRYLKGSGLANQLKMADVFAAWERAVPEEFKPFARLAGFKKRIATIHVNSSPVLQELSQFHKESIRKALTRELGGIHVEDVKFVLADHRR